MYGPAVWAFFGAYNQVSNVLMVAVAFHLDDSDEGNLKVDRAVIVGGVAAGLGLFVAGFSIMLYSMPARYRRTFYRHDTLKAYLSRIWDERTESRRGWGEGHDAARALIVMEWHHVYLPTGKVRAWLVGWNAWERQEPPWFTERWREHAYKYLKDADVLPKAALRQMTRKEAEGG